MAGLALIPRAASARRAVVSVLSSSRLRTVNRRGISLNFLKRKNEAEQEWAFQAMQIKEGKLPHILDTLEARGFRDAVIGNEGKVREILRLKRIGVYTGVDPTADSLHVGNLLPLMAVFLMWMHGFQGSTVLGGATARIGDPAGRAETRPMMESSTISRNVTKIHYQLKSLWANCVFLAAAYGYRPHRYGFRRLLNNSMWICRLTLYDWLKRLAVPTRMGPHLGRTFVKTRLESKAGLSLGEFLYPMIQGWDFWHLYSSVEVQMQIGGADQYGNILSGVEFVKTIRDSETNDFIRPKPDWKNDPIGLTVPLLLDGSGQKFGKSDGNAIWLDAAKTSPFELYGWFLRRPDNEVEDLLKRLTFIPLPEIATLMEEQRADPPKRVAHHNIAFNVIFLVHGQATALRTWQEHQTLYGSTVVPSLIDHCKKANISGAPPQLSTAKGKDGSGAETVVLGSDATNRPEMDLQLPDSLVRGTNVINVLVAARLVSSKLEAQRLVKDGGLYVAASNGRAHSMFPGSLDWAPLKVFYLEEVDRYLFDGRLLILRRGSHNIRIIEIVSDEDYEKSGQTYPGMPGTGKVRQAMKDVMLMAKKAGVVVSRKEITDILRFDQSERGSGKKIKTTRSGPEAVKAKLLRDRVTALEALVMSKEENDATGAQSEVVLDADIERAKRKVVERLLADEIPVETENIPVPKAFITWVPKGPTERTYFPRPPKPEPDMTEVGAKSSTPFPKKYSWSRGTQGKTSDRRRSSQSATSIRESSKEIKPFAKVRAARRVTRERGYADAGLGEGRSRAPRATPVYMRPD